MSETKGYSQQALRLTNRVLLGGKATQILEGEVCAYGPHCVPHCLPQLYLMNEWIQMSSYNRKKQYLSHKIYHHSEKIQPN